MKSLILALVFVTTIQCIAQKESTAITAEDIASALQMKKWLIKMPEDSSPKKLLALKVTFNGEGEFVGSFKVKPGTVTTLLIWDDGNNRTHNFNWRNDTSGRLGKLTHDAFYTSSIFIHNTDKICSVGDVILSGRIMDSDDELEYKVEICLKDK